MATDQAGSPGGGTATPASSLGQVHRIDEQTLLVQRQELNIDAKQPDVANAVFHRTGDTVVIVDTGVTEAFRKALRDSRILHLGDEDNGPCGSMPDADQVQGAIGLRPGGVPDRFRLRADDHRRPWFCASGRPTRCSPR